MKKLLGRFIGCIAFLLLGAAALAQGVIQADRIDSQILGQEVPFNVYLPAGFQDSDATYPAVYLLHGLSDTYEAWNHNGRIKDVADLLIASGEITPMVIIMPNAGHPDIRGEWNGYFNMPGWNYEDFFFREFMPAVEKRYRCIGDKAHRAIMGLSMGGGGSTAYSQRHPDCFSSCYAMSAWLDNGEDEVGPLDGSDRFALVCQAVHNHSCLDFLRNADEATLEKLRTVAWFFDCGDDDFLFDLSIEIHRLMKRAGVHDELRVRDGVHNWEYWHTALYTALPFASRNFEK
ncbi:MAG: esterase family protein [Bacteroidota bacterium]|nr:esterase family protein [Bacteroidota bacterium]